MRIEDDDPKSWRLSSALPQCLVGLYGNLGVSSSSQQHQVVGQSSLSQVLVQGCLGHRDGVESMRGSAGLFPTRFCDMYHLPGVFACILYCEVGGGFNQRLETILLVARSRLDYLTSQGR